MINTTILLDKLLNYLRKKTYFNFLESNEIWLTKTGLFCLSYIIPIVSIITAITLSIRTDLNARILWIPTIVVCVSSILLRYIAEKMLPYVKNTINKATTKISSFAVLDVLTMCIGFLGVLVLFGSIYTAIEFGDWNMLFSGFFTFVLCEYYMAILLAPAESINVIVDEKATPADNFIGILSVVVKSIYRLVPAFFGSAMIFCLIYLFDMLFAEEGTPISEVFASGQSAMACFGMALLPLIGYLLFLSYYFAIDICAAFLQIPKKLEEIAKQKK